MVMIMDKMNKIFFICYSIAFCGCAAAENYEISVTENPNTCKGDSCLNEDHKPQQSVTYNPSSTVTEVFTFTYKIRNLDEEELHLMPTSKQPLGDINHIQEFQQEIPHDKEQYIFFESPEEMNSTYITEAQYNVTNVTELSKLPENDVSSSTAEPDVTKTTSTTKLNLPTTQTPSTSFLLSSGKKSKKICFCDIQLNQCDINCCCDEDCTPFHFKVFTKCNDKNAMHDLKYCYSTNFIFGNNTSYKMVKSNEGLFCIVRENLKHGVNYKTSKVLTSLDTFNKSLMNNSYTFSIKSSKKLEFTNKYYLAGSPVWILQNGEITPFNIMHSSVGILCNAEVTIKYLVDEVKSCLYQQQPKSQCGGTKIGKVLQNLRGMKVISNPVHLNKSQLVNSTKLCKTNTCIGITSYLCQSIDNSSDCIKIMNNSTDFSDISCWSSLSRIQYKIWHNGSEGIAKMEAYLWVKKLPKISDEFLSQLTTEVRYSWIGSRKVFKRSGNPGYLTGKPILAGRKIHNTVTGTTDKKEAIELSLDPRDWLSVLGSEKGICSSEERIPVNFRENGQYVCSLKLSKNNFSKEKCVELQNNIFKLLIGNDVINDMKENYFNKFVATFGNSRVEETGDWVQVLLDTFPIISSQVYFKSNYYHLTCKNVITDLYVDVVYSNTGSFLAPQAKILGVSFQFGKHKDLTYFCDTPGCENITFQYFKLSSAINFVDVTKPATDAFAEPLSLEVKLPHDFFYPFFSKGARSHVSGKFVLVLLFLSIL